MLKLNPPRTQRLLRKRAEVTSIFVSSSLNTRSLAAIADCRMLYFSLKS